MLKQTLTYEDYFGETRTEDLYFNLSKADLAEMLTEDEDLQTRLATVAESNNGAQIIRFFKEFALKAYGERSEDGKRFIKSDKISEEFSQTAAFETLLGKILTYELDPVKFIMGILPADLAKEAQEKMNENNGLPQDFKKKAN